MNRIALPLIILLAAACLTFPAAIGAAAGTILYVPMDDRPVNLEYAADSVTGAGLSILVPPPDMLAGLNREGDPDRLWEWVNANAPMADALVLSADALLYGGLVDSRIHSYGPVTLEMRAKRFAALRTQSPRLPILVFTTVMRSPKYSAPPVEPPYYRHYGNAIFTYTALLDKESTRGLSAEEKLRREQARAAIPDYALDDWLQRRQMNHNANRSLLQHTREGCITYLLIGRDDTSPFSQSHKEMRQLSREAAGLTDSTFASFPGADQLGLVLLARAYNLLTGQQPKVAVFYAMGPEAATVPSYEDQPFGLTVATHITAAGGVIHNGFGRPDLTLAVNTPLQTDNHEAESVDNIPFVTPATRQFVGRVENSIRLKIPVAVADVAYANGSDNSLMAELSRRKLLYSLSAYSGWNTASNTLGYAVAQGMLLMNAPDKNRRRLLTIRYLDDWAWQANIRQEVFRDMPDAADSLRYLSSPGDKAEALAKTKLRAFAQQKLGWPPGAIELSFPWNRLFEIDVRIMQE